MKTIITTVGTSLFTNFNDKNKAFIEEYENIEKLPHSYWDVQLELINRIRNCDEFIVWISKNLPLSCAEISSVIKISEEVDDDLNVCLLATDTVLSRLAAEIIKAQVVRSSNGKNISIIFDHSSDVINGLQINDPTEFETIGLQNLVSRFDKIQTESITSNQPLLLNITGGFKGLIPYFTLLGQINAIPIKYLFEESKKLITIPQLPIDIDWDIMERFFVLVLSKMTAKQIEATLSEKDIGYCKGLESLVKIDCDTKKATLLPMGIVMRSYIENELPISRAALGFLIEYKIIKQLTFKIQKYASCYEDRKNIKYDEVIIPLKYSLWNDSEIDIILQPKTDPNKFIAIEVKSISQLIAHTADIVKQINIQIHGNSVIHGFIAKKQIPQEFHLLLYSFIEPKNKTIDYLMSLCNYKIIPLFNSMPSCKFRLCIASLDLSNSSREDENPFSAYMGYGKLSLKYK